VQLFPPLVLRGGSGRKHLMRATRSPRYAKAANTTLHGYFENTDHDEDKLPERRNSFDKSTDLIKMRFIRLERTHEN
jgi:hypothetical protein